MSDEAKPATAVAPTPFIPPSRIDPAELAKAFQDEGIVPTPEAEAAPITEKTTITEKKAPVGDAQEEQVPALVKLAQERAALRKESEANKPYLDVLRDIPPATASAVAKAIKSGDPVALLAAVGMTHSQYTARLLGEAAPAEEKSAPAEKTGNPEFDTLRQELQALKAEREAEKMQSTRTQVMSQMQTALKDNPKFNLINKLGDYDGVEKVLIQYHAKHGELPGSTFEESVQLAAEFYEANLKKEAARWQGVLTPGTVPASTAPKAPEQPKAGTVTTRTLTNSNTSAPAPVKTVPKTRQEVLAAILEGREEELEA
jgi:hypothetical protein